MKKLLLGLLCTITLGAYANPADDLLNRIDKGAAAKFKTILVKSDKDFFEIDQAGNGKITISSDNGIFDGTIELRIHDREEVKTIMNQLRNIDDLQEVQRIL